MRVNITLDKDQLIGPSVVEAFQDELTRRIRSVFPSTLVTVKKGSMTGVELQGIEREADREALDNILREVWEDESWR
ncbi:DinI family protein [Enterobacter ludwigii]|nr:DinI family protein [Enterobacter ludwigii]